MFGRPSGVKLMMRACDVLHRHASVIDPEVVRFDGGLTVLRVRTNIDSYLLTSLDGKRWVSIPVLVDPTTGEPKDDQLRLPSGLFGPFVSFKPDPGQLATAILQEVVAGWDYLIQQGPEALVEVDPRYEYAVAARAAVEGEPGDGVSTA
ncbi:hypothetical protein [Streptomyces sp. SID13031]|uniref:hypothetical protein n=1 Tax=Streptomyces sp. SID13031 TaxID=2706046 RepID=UPI0013C58E53|nr:hypothetical protein [Streptomyces sp. SID13031]NEA32022.1 hypothetical protein [Streptomyces sp. SID13031]